MAKKLTGHGGRRSATSGIWDGGNTGKSSTQQTARKGALGGAGFGYGGEENGKEAYDTNNTNWGAGATRGVYSVYSNLSDKEATNRNLLQSRLWKGVPQLNPEQLSAFEAAYTGHTFFFVVDVPKFLTTGIYKNTNAHQAMRNLKSIIERAAMSFSGFSPITAEFSDQNDGAGNKLSHMTYVHKDQTDITLRLHEFAALPVKNAIEMWLTGVYDYKSQHGHYFGNLGIPGGWCLANHTMSLLVVQVDPTWTVIQDCAYYYNMMPREVPFDHFAWTKGEYDIVQDADISFVCNEERSPAIMYAAEKYMNARILSLVSTSVFNSRQFVVNDFETGSLISSGHTGEVGNGVGIIDNQMYNVKITNGMKEEKKEVYGNATTFVEDLANVDNHTGHDLEWSNSDEPGYYTKPSTAESNTDTAATDNTTNQ